MQRNKRKNAKQNKQAPNLLTLSPRTAIFCCGRGEV